MYVYCLDVNNLSCFLVLLKTHVDWEAFFPPSCRLPTEMQKLEVFHSALQASVMSWSL